MKLKSRYRLAMTLLVAAVTLMLFTISASAAAETGRAADIKLMDGVWESTVYVTDANQNNVRAHILRISHNSNVALKTSSAYYYKKSSTQATRKKASFKWGYVTLGQMIKNYESSKDKEGKVIAGINGDFYDKDAAGKTLGKLIMEGRVVNSSGSEPFFAVMRDGSYRIMEAGESTADVVEALAGPDLLVHNGANLAPATGGGEAIICLGLTPNSDLVFVCVDGRESTCAGTTYYDVADIMIKQGCTEVLHLDGGGSASFVTSRYGGAAAQRNTANDGLPRPVSSALLVVKKSSAGTTPDNADFRAVSMKESGTELVKSGGKWKYTAKGKPVSGFRVINDQQYLFNSNGVGMTKTITLGKNKYYYVKGLLSKTTDSKAGRIGIGFCGASKNGQNLLYAYHYGDKKLNVGLNPLVKNNSGKMKNWTNVMYVPWMSEIRYIKEANFGKGVKNLGGYAFYISPDPFNSDAKKLGSYLKKVTLPASMKTIGAYAFTNNQKLRGLTIPKNVSSIGKNAFSYNKNIKYTFKRKTPPKFSGKIFSSTGKKVVIKSPSSKKWKSLLSSSKKKKKLGFKGKVKYTK